MTKTTDPHRKKLIQLIHVGKGKLGLDREAYEAILEGVAGKTSSADMDERELRAVLAAMRRAGFNGGKKLQVRPGEAPLCSKEKLYYIKGLWELAARNKTEKALAAFVRRIAHVDDIRFLDDRAATKVILALREIARKAGFDPDGPLGRAAP
jgi:phage gp16-like protein